jgi:aubergine-like protein
MTNIINPEEHSSIEKFIFSHKSDYKPVDNKDLTIATNFFKFRLSNNSSKTYFKYDVAFFPEIPGDAQKMRRQVIRKAKEHLEQKLGFYLFNSTVLYARENISDPIEIDVQLDEQTYKVIVTWVQSVQNDSFEAQSVYKKYFFNMVNNLKYVQLRKNFFNPKAARTLKEFNVEVWTGFNPTISLLENQVLLNLNVVNRVIRFETALDLLNKISNNKEHSNIKEAIDSTFKGMTVVTRYNGDKTYTIEGVDLEKNPSDLFESKEGKVSYIEYYQKKYNKKILPNQPLLIFKDRKEKIIHLIPELCFLTGLTEEMRANFQLMSRMAEITKGNPKIKVEESLSLLKSIKENDQCQKDMVKWGITVDENPLVITGKKINAGSLELGKRVTVDIENTQDLDRQIQKQMFTQPKINEWAVNYINIRLSLTTETLS